MRARLHETQPWAWGIFAALAYILVVACALDLGGCAQMQQRVDQFVERGPHDVAVARIDVSTASESSSCTAWKISDGFAVTAAHCCKDVTTFRMGGAHGGIGEAVAPRIGEGRVDVCELIGTILGDPLQLAKDEPTLGAEVWIQGYPGGEYVLTRGTWSGIDQDGDGVVTAPGIGPGASGSPVLDPRGRVIGQVYGVSPYVAGIVYLVPLAQLRTFLGWHTIGK